MNLLKLATFFLPIVVLPLLSLGLYILTKNILSVVCSWQFLHSSVFQKVIDPLLIFVAFTSLPLLYTITIFRSEKISPIFQESALFSFAMMLSIFSLFVMFLGREYVIHHLPEFLKNVFDSYLFYEAVMVFVLPVLLLKGLQTMGLASVITNNVVISFWPFMIAVVISGLIGGIIVFIGSFPPIR